MKIENIKEYMEMDIGNCDFKDKINYTEEVDLDNKSNLQKWIIFDNYGEDPDVVLKKNKVILNILDWDGKWLDMIFPIRQVLRTLLHTVGDKVVVEDLLVGRREVFDIIDRKKLFQELKKGNIEHSRAWLNVFNKEMEDYAKNVHTIGNYMPCPDRNYNRIKGFCIWHYNDRIDLLYSDLYSTTPKNSIITKDKEEWKKWFDENIEKLYLKDILDVNTISELNRFSCLKKRKMSAEQLKVLPFYLRKVNKLIEKRTALISKAVNKRMEEELFNYFKNYLAHFPKDTIFMQVTDFLKGYIEVLPEYEKECDLLVEHFRLRKYGDGWAIDKEVGNDCYNRYIEYAYLALYDLNIFDECLEDKNGFQIEDNSCMYDRINRALYYAFRENGLIRYSKMFLHLRESSRTTDET